jgi:hypothetical protein
MSLRLLFLLGFLMSGCAQDPFERPATWSLPPEGLGANDSNLRAMVANPQDLSSPRDEESTSVGSLSTRPVDLLLEGRRARLPSVNASTIGAGGSSQQTQGASGPSGGTGAQ